MKNFAIVAFILSLPSLAFAASATLDHTKKLNLKFENTSDVQIVDLILSPKFSCWTTQSQGGGIAYTDEEVAKTLFQVDSVFSGRFATVSIQHMNSISIKAPKREKPLNAQNCGVMVYLAAKTVKGESIQFGGAIARVQSNRSNVNFTSLFEQNVQGEYVFQSVFAGTSYDSQTNGRMNVCDIVVSKKVNGKLQPLSNSYNFRIDRCKI
jgi:phage pi2 protein 07